MSGFSTKHQKSEAEGLPRAQGQRGLPREYQPLLGHSVRRSIAGGQRRGEKEGRR